MSEAIIVALIGGGFSLLVAIVGALINRSKASKKEIAEQARRDQKIDDKFAEISRKLDEHNGYAQKFAETHDDIVAMKKDIEYLRNNRK